MNNRRYVKKILGYFLQGLIYFVPVAVTLYVIFRIFVFIDGIIPVRIPGLGILTLFLLITATGYLGSTIIAQPVIHYFQRLIDRAPLIKTLYSAVKDLLSAFVEKKKRFNKPVLVRLSRENDFERLGFVTSSDLKEIGIGEGKVAVYIPHSYNFSGNLVIVPSENVTPIEASPAEMMKFIVSGGVVSPD